MCILTLGDQVDGAAARSAYLWAEHADDGRDPWVPDKEDDASSGDEGYSTDSTEGDAKDRSGDDDDDGEEDDEYGYATDSSGTPHHSPGCLVVPALALGHPVYPRRWGRTPQAYTWIPSEDPCMIEWSPDGTKILCSFRYKLSVFSASGLDEEILSAPVQMSRIFSTHGCVVRPSRNATRTAPHGPASLTPPQAAPRRCARLTGRRTRGVSPSPVAVAASPTFTPRTTARSRSSMWRTAR